MQSFSLQVGFSIQVIADGSLRSGDLLVILSSCCFPFGVWRMYFYGSSCFSSCCGVDVVTMESRFVTVLGSIADEEHLMSWMVDGSVFAMRCRIGISE